MVKQARSQLGPDFCIILELRCVYGHDIQTGMNEKMGNKSSDSQFRGKFVISGFSKCSL